VQELQLYYKLSIPHDCTINFHQRMAAKNFVIEAEIDCNVDVGYRGCHLTKVKSIELLCSMAYPSFNADWNSFLILLKVTYTSNIESN